MGVVEEGIRLALTMVTLLVKKKQKNCNNTHPRMREKAGCCASIMRLIALLAALRCVFLQVFNG